MAGTSNSLQYLIRFNQNSVVQSVNLLLVLSIVKKTQVNDWNTYNI